MGTMKQTKSVNLSGIAARAKSFKSAHIVFRQDTCLQSIGNTEGNTQGIFLKLLYSPLLKYLSI